MAKRFMERAPGRFTGKVEPGEVLRLLWTAGWISDPKDGYTFEDIRYTRSKDGRTLYVIALGWPGAGTVVIPESLAKNSITGTITGVSMIGSDRPVSWEWQNERLALTTPNKKVNDLAVVFKITADSAVFK